MSVKKKNILKTSGVVIILLIGLFSMNFLGSTEKTSNKRDFKPEVRTVEVQSVNFGDIALEIKGNGVIVPQKSLSLISEVSGMVTYAKNNLKSGTPVKKGEVILELDAREIENQLYSLRSDFLNTVASLLPDLKIEDENVYNKWHKYFLAIDIENQIPNLPEISNSQEKIKVSTRNIITKYYSVKNQEILLSKHEVSSPFSGYIKSNGIIENSYVSKGQHLFDIEDVVNLEIAVPLLVKDLNMINFNNSPRVKILASNDPDNVIYGRIVRTDQKLERNSQSLNAYVVFSNSNLNSNFLPGNYVDILIEGKNLKNVASIPRHIIQENKYVYTLEEGKLSRRMIDLLFIQQDQAIISNTLPPNTNIVTTILQKPIVGMEIQTIGNSMNPKEIVSSENSESKDNNLQ